MRRCYTISEFWREKRKDPFPVLQAKQEKVAKCKLRKIFSTRRIIVSQGKEKEQLKKLFSARRIIVSQGKEVEKLRKLFFARKIIVSQ